MALNMVNYRQMSRQIKEADLFAPLKQWIEGQGYSVHGEVRNCDLVARKGEELVIVEMKKNLNLTLLTQAAARKEITDSVYIAVPLPPGKKTLPNFRRVRALLRRLEIGCIFVDFLKTRGRVRIELHPLPFSPRPRPGKKRAILREIDGRYAEFNLGGESSHVEKITAYKQEALRTALILSREGTCSPRQLRELGASEKVQTILSRNVYGWFEKIDRGMYTLHPAGVEALHNYRDIIKTIEEKHSNRL